MTSVDEVYGVVLSGRLRGGQNDNDERNTVIHESSRS